jgi:hypothetical protein
MFAWFVCSSRYVTCGYLIIGFGGREFDGDVNGEHWEATHAKTVPGRRMWATCGEAASWTKIVVNLRVIGFSSFSFSVSSSLDFISYHFPGSHVLHLLEKRIISTRQSFSHAHLHLLPPISSLTPLLPAPSYPMPTPATTWPSPNPKLNKHQETLPLRPPHLRSKSSLDNTIDTVRNEYVHSSTGMSE